MQWLLISQLVIAGNRTGFRFIVLIDKNCTTSKDYDAISKNKVTVQFKNVPKKNWVVGMRSFTKDPATNKKVFSRWSNLMTANMK